MLSALILVCSFATASNLEACTEATAQQVIRDPEVFANPIACFVHGQAYFAETALVREPTDIIKIVCAKR
jgi:hypothetical protein